MAIVDPSANVTVNDNAFGSQGPVGTGVAVVGCSSSGTADSPKLYSSIETLVSEKGHGPGVEASALLINAGIQVLFCRGTGGTAGTTDPSVTPSATGTSAVTVTGTAYDTYDGIITLESADGTVVGTGAVKFNYSLDGGETNSGTINIGTANSYLIPNTGLTINFGAGDVDSGDSHTFATIEPMMTAGNLGTAFDALEADDNLFAFVLVAQHVSKTLADTLETKATGLASADKFVRVISNARPYEAGESDSAYQADADITAFDDFASLRVGIAAGHPITPSPISGRQNLRPLAWTAAVRKATRPLSEDLANRTTGPVSGIALRNSAGALVAHDERINPGLNSARFITVKSRPGQPGVWFVNPHLMAPSNSDFELWQYGSVMDVACTVSQAALELKLSTSVLLDKTTGYIAEFELRKIEASVNNALRNALTAPGHASSARIVLSRTDDVLATKTLTGEVRVVPLGTIKTITLSVGFENPVILNAAA